MTGVPVWVNWWGRGDKGWLVWVVQKGTRYCLLRSQYQLPPHLRERCVNATADTRESCPNASLFEPFFPPFSHIEIGGII